MELVFQDVSRFDIIHFHCDYLHFPLLRRQPCPSVTTLHGRVHRPDLGPLFAEYAEVPLVSISDDQRRPIPEANWQATVYHGLPRDLLHLPATAGRLPGVSGPHVAREGRRSGHRDRPAGRHETEGRRQDLPRGAGLLHEIDRAACCVESRAWVEFIGEVGGREKDEFLGNARALLFPIDWPEPFGLVMIEALACGTPVIAWRNGSGARGDRRTA